LRCLSHGIQARVRQEGFDQIDTKVEELASETGERVNYMVQEHGKAVCLSQALGERGVQFELGVGDRIPLHIISAGKAILASWEDEAIEQYLTEHGLTEATENTIVDERLLWDDIERIRNRGYSQSQQEYMGELNGVAAPVYGTDESVIGAIGVSGPAHRMQGERFNTRLPELLMGTAREIALNLQYSD
jgi:DNA-binding IclR family transcriptional regulator